MSKDEKKNKTKQKKNRINSYWVMLLMRTIWEYWDIITFDTVFLIWFFGNLCPKIYIKKIFKTIYLFIIQNFPVSLDQNVPIIFVKKIYFGKYWNNLAYENLIEFKTFTNFDNFPFLISEPKMFWYSKAQKYLRRAKCPNTLNCKDIPGGKIF